MPINANGRRQEQREEILVIVLMMVCDTKKKVKRQREVLNTVCIPPRLDARNEKNCYRDLCQPARPRKEMLVMVTTIVQDTDKNVKQQEEASNTVLLQLRCGARNKKKKGQERTSWPRRRVLFLLPDIVDGGRACRRRRHGRKPRGGQEAGAEAGRRAGARAGRQSRELEAKTNTERVRKLKARSR